MAGRAADSRTKTGGTVVFLLNLLQDVNVARGLVYLTARETDARIVLLVSQGFLKRDRQTSWQREVAALATDTGAELFLYGSADEARAVLDSGTGVIFAASESNLRAHVETSGVFAAAPPGYIRVTLQHGMECVGFLQSREHVMSHGRNVGFGADIICGWLEPEALTSLIASERSKLHVTGPPTLLQRPGSRPSDRQDGLICENMHSVRLNASGDHRASFMEMFFAFSREIARRGETLTLRPHPGGQYVLKNDVPLPPNVRLNNEPIYDVNLKAYRFGISAPSTIVLDMVLAGIPVGVWRDSAGIMDSSVYSGLTEISTLNDWLAFERDARIRPEMILDRQRSYLARLGMTLDAAEVYRRFARLIVASLTRPARELPMADMPRRATRGSVAPRPASLSGNLLVDVAR